jgi:hypothetical protein
MAPRWILGRGFRSHHENLRTALGAHAAYRLQDVFKHGPDLSKEEAIDAAAHLTLEGAIGRPTAEKVLNSTWVCQQAEENTETSRQQYVRGLLGGATRCRLQ